MISTIYVRDKGPICYEAMISNDPQALNMLPENLLSSGLKWYWESIRSGSVADNSKGQDLAPERPLTLLTSDNIASLIGDFQERDIDDYRRFIAIFGVDSTMMGPPLVDDTQLRIILKNFIMQEEGSIRIVIIQIGDKPYEYIFIPHNPIDPVQQLLEIWGVLPLAKHKIRPYKQLHLAQLESLYTLAQD